MKGIDKYIQLIIIIAIIFVVNIIANYFYTDFDLTDDKRFTLSESTKKIVESADDNITIKILLDGDFPSGFKRLQSSVKDMMSKFRDINPRIVYEFEDPTNGSVSVVENRRKQLAEDNIIPVNLSYSDGTQFVQKPVFPFAIITYKARKQIVNLLEEQKPGDDEEIILNQSVALLEYKFANAFQKMQAVRLKNILFTSANEELDESRVFRLQSELSRYYKVGRVGLDSLMMIDTTIDLLIVAAPKTPFSKQNQFKIDQYIMNGGNVIWMIDKYDISLDSIATHKFYIPEENNYDLDDLLFKYGVRIRPDLVIDLECSQIPQVIGMIGDKPQMRLFPWIYHPVVASQNNHPIVKNIDRVNFYFPSTLDTLKTDADIKKTVLLKSSRYSRDQLMPVRLTFEILRNAPDPTKFNNGHRPLAVILEGEFDSYFKNRLTPDFQSTLDMLGLKFVEHGKPSKQIVISDADFAKNLVSSSTGTTEDIGYNKWEQRYYKGNKDFILNAVEYMLDENNILEARSKEIKLRLLDSIRTKAEKTKWQWINVGLPVFVLIIFGLIYHFIRRRRYAS